jgi:ATP-binding cassette, subfamily B, bacterial MsbA
MREAFGVRGLNCGPDDPHGLEQRLHPSVRQQNGVAKTRAGGEHDASMNNILSVLRFGRGYMSRYWTRLACVVLFSVVFAMSNASFVLATRTLIDRFSPKPAVRQELAEKATAPASGLTERLRELNQSLRAVFDPWLPRVGEPFTWRQIAGCLLFLPLLVSVRAVADYLGNYCMGWVSERVIRDVRLDVMEKLSALSLDFFTRSTTGDLMTRINVDSLNLLRALRQGTADLIKESLNLLVLLAVMLRLDPLLTLYVMVLLPLCILPLIVLGKKARRAMAASLRANVSQSSQLVELLGGIRVIKAFNLEADEIARFRKTSGQLVHAGMKGVQAKELLNPIIEIVSMIGFGALLVYVFKSGRSGSDLGAFLAAVLFFFLSIKKLAGVRILFDQASVGVERLEEILSEQPKVVEPLNPRPVTEFKSAISFEHVTFAYGEKDVLHDFSLTIPRGFKLGIAGESGSGKTTLVNLLFRFYDPTSGAVKIDGLDLRDVSIRDLRQQLALVSQDVTIFDQTVAENIASGKAGATREEIEAAARAAFAHDFIMQLPQGYDTRVAERGATLSGGQKQRLSIARAFVRNAPILVLDEATAQLDPKAEAEVQKDIERLAEHRTVICVAHRLSTLANMDKIIVLTDGRIVESGGFADLLRQGGVFAAMAARQGMTTG